MKQLDLNVLRPEAKRLPKLYAGDSINWITVRIHFDDKDEDAIMQMLVDHRIMPAIWNFQIPIEPTEAAINASMVCPPSHLDSLLSFKVKLAIRQILKRVGL